MADFTLERATFRSRDLTAFVELLRNAFSALFGVDVDISIADMDDRDGDPTVAFDVEGFILYKTPLTFAKGLPHEKTVDGWALDGVTITLPTREDPGDQDYVEIATAGSDLDAIKMLIDAIVAQRWEGYTEMLADEAEAQQHADIAEFELRDFQSDSD